MCENKGNAGKTGLQKVRNIREKDVSASEKESNPASGNPYIRPKKSRRGGGEEKKKRVGHIRKALPLSGEKKGAPQP